MKRASKIILCIVGVVLLLFAALFTGAFFTSVIAASGYEVNLQITTLVIAALALFTVFLPKRENALNAITVEFWVNYIIENLFKDNAFLNHCHNADDNVLNGSVVYIPQAGAPSKVVKNRQLLPATVQRRSDTDISYALDVYTSDPRLITKAELMEISYDKIDNVLREDMAWLKQVIAEEMLYKWRPEGAAQFVKTTGTDLAAHMPGATGNRKLYVKENLKRAQTLMNKANLPKEGRVALHSSEMLDQLMEDPDLKKRDVGMEMDLKNGVVARLYGFDIMERSSTLTADNSGTPVIKALEAATATTDNDAVVCWQKDAVERALGTVDFFENIKDALYFGDVYSMLVKMGGRKRRADNLGIIGIVQANS